MRIYQSTHKLDLVIHLPQNVEDLKTLARVHGGREQVLEDCRLLLGGSAFSRKDVRLSGDKWIVFNYIDETEQTLTDEELFTDSNIGAGLNKDSILYAVEKCSCDKTE